MSTDVLRALIRDGWHADATTDMSDGTTEHTLTRAGAEIALTVRGGQVVTVLATGRPELLVDAVRAVATALPEVAR